MLDLAKKVGLLVRVSGLHWSQSGDVRLMCCSSYHQVRTFVAVQATLVMYFLTDHVGWLKQAGAKSVP